MCETALEKLAQTSCPVQRHTSETETAALKRLIAKHGHDYGAMARDIRLNRWQVSFDGQIMDLFY